MPGLDDNEVVDGRLMQGPCGRHPRDALTVCEDLLDVSPPLHVLLTYSLGTVKIKCSGFS